MPPVQATGRASGCKFRISAWHWYSSDPFRFFNMLVSNKEICALLDLSENTASEYLKKIRDEYKIYEVTKWHLMEWLGLDWYAMEISWQIRINKNMGKALEILELREKRRVTLKNRKNP